MSQKDLAGLNTTALHVLRRLVVQGMSKVTTIDYASISGRVADQELKKRKLVEVRSTPKGRTSWYVATPAAIALKADIVEHDERLQKKLDAERKAEEELERIQKAGVLLFEACSIALPLMRDGFKMAQQLGRLQDAGHYEGTRRQIVAALKAAKPDVDWDA